MRKPLNKQVGLANSVGQQIAKRRLALGVKQAELAERVDVDPVTISRLERGVALPSLINLEKIARALELGLGELFGAASRSPGDQIGRIDRLLLSLTDRERDFLVDLIERQVAFMHQQREPARPAGARTSAA